jgi:hypothetical protein
VGRRHPAGLPADLLPLTCGEYRLAESTLFISAQTSSARTAGVMVYLDESPIAQCSVDLETFDASCSDIDI